MFRLMTSNKNTANDVTLKPAPGEYSAYDYQQFGQLSALSPDGSKVITRTNYNASIMCFDAVNGTRLFSQAEPSGMTSTSISPDGTRLGIGQGFYFTGGKYQGRVTILNAVSGATIRTIENPRLNQDDFFGNNNVEFSRDNSIIAVGSPIYKDAGGSNTLGTVHIFNGNTGALLRTFTDPLGASSSVFRFFGHRIRLSGDGSLIAIGSYGENTSTGAVRVYNVSTGALVRAFTSPAAATGNNYGFDIGINDDMSLIAISEQMYKISGNEEGRVYLYELSSGTLLRTYENPMPADSATFGENLGMSRDGSRLAVYYGAYNGGDLSAVSVYSTTSTTPIVTYYDAARSNGVSQSISADGSRVIYANKNGNAIDPGNINYNYSGYVKVLSI